MGALVWITGVLGAFGFFMSGMMKLTGQAMAKEMLEHVGAADKRMLIGAAEVAGAIGLIIGAISSPGDGEWFGVLAALGLIGLIAGALMAHQKAGDAIKDMAPALVMGAIPIVYLIALLANN